MRLELEARNVQIIIFLRNHLDALENLVIRVVIHHRAVLRVLHVVEYISTPVFESWIQIEVAFVQITLGPKVGVLTEVNSIGWIKILIDDVTCMPLEALLLDGHLEYLPFKLVESRPDPQVVKVVRMLVLML